MIYIVMIGRNTDPATLSLYAETGISVGAKMIVACSIINYHKREKIKVRNRMRSDSE